MLPCNRFGPSFLTGLPDYGLFNHRSRVGNRFTVSNLLGIIAAMNMWTSADWTLTATAIVALVVRGAHGRLWPTHSFGGVVTGIAFLEFGLTCIVVGSDYERRWGQPLLATVAIASAALVMGAGYAAPWLVTMVRRAGMPTADADD